MEQSISRLKTGRRDVSPEEYAVTHAATNILLAHGLDTPGNTVGDILTLLNPEEREVVAKAERIYNRD